jgi:peptidoglycan hydrolase CwlO-like protein
MKKVIATTAILGIISLAGIQTVSAHSGNYSSNNDYCGNYGTYDRTYSEKDTEALEKFQSETSSVRKEIVVKRSELNALLRQENPDEKRVAKLTGDLYDLETELDAKAEKTGARSRFAYGHGPGMMGYGGWRHGRHMMGW